MQFRTKKTVLAEVETLNYSQPNVFILLKLDKDPKTIYAGACAALKNMEV